jgi:hypothetical protein
VLRAIYRIASNTVIPVTVLQSTLRLLCFLPLLPAAVAPSFPPPSPIHTVDSGESLQCHPTLDQRIVARRRALSLLLMPAAQWRKTLTMTTVISALLRPETHYASVLDHNDRVRGCRVSRPPEPS